ncbi:MAG: TetR/AcrR family transcriptional regulator [Lachnospiraceae bacterium]|nr:TetR/AcrR family transcriptional regulator [Lachnospiraceae bacterium]
MNPKFFDVKKEKQDAIINAALKVFAENGYRKASTDVIVKEAGISKGLLFHYFISKQGVYEFIYDYSVKYMMLELNNAVNKKETDFFAIQRMIEACRTRVMKNYPYMQQFLTGVKYETHADALKVIGQSENAIEDTYNSIYKKVDMQRFQGGVDLKKVIKMIGWMSDGYIKDKFLEGTPDLDEMNAEFAGYLAMLRGQFYGKVAQEEPMPVTEDLVDTGEADRDDSVMDSMRENTVAKISGGKAEELSFEERLMSGKRSPYAEKEEVTEETAAAAAEEPEEIKEEIKEEASAEEVEVAVEAAAEEKEETVEAKETEEEAEVEAEAEEETEETETEAETAETETEDGTEAETAEAQEEEAEAEDETAETEETEESIEAEAADDEDEEEEEEAAAPAPKEEKRSKKDKEIREVTISIDDFSDSFKSADKFTYGGDGVLYAASGAVASYIPDSKMLRYYETSRLSDFTYGSDSRGGRGIPYDSSDNIQIFVEEEDEESFDNNNDDFDIDGLTDKIMSNTEKESAEFDRARELNEMGPAPVLPEFTPDKLRKMNDDDDENGPVYRPINF